MSAATYSATAILNLFLRGEAAVAPARIYVSLHTADPGNAGDNEVTTDQWPSYARQDPAAGGAIDTGFSEPAAKSSANTMQMLWPALDGPDPVTLTHFAIWDALTDGNCLFGGQLAVAKEISPTDECVFHAGALEVVIDP